MNEDKQFYDENDESNGITDQELMEELNSMSYEDRLGAIEAVVNSMTDEEEKKNFINSLNKLRSEIKTENKKQLKKDKDKEKRRKKNKLIRKQKQKNRRKK